jgi:hypothetical protein
MSFVKDILKKLVDDGFIKKIKKNNSNNKSNVDIVIVKDKEIKEKIKEYFNGRRMECLVSMNEIKCEINYD